MPQSRTEEPPPPRRRGHVHPLSRIRAVATPLREKKMETPFNLQSTLAYINVRARAPFRQARGFQAVPPPDSRERRRIVSERERERGNGVGDVPGGAPRHLPPAGRRLPSLRLRRKWNTHLTSRTIYVGCSIVCCALFDGWLYDGWMDVAGGVLDRPLADRAGVHSGDHLRRVRAGGLSCAKRRTWRFSICPEVRSDVRTSHSPSVHVCLDYAN